VGGGEDYEQEKGTGKGQVLGMMKEIYSGKRHMGK